MKCKECGKELSKVMVKVEGAKSKVVSYQCNCGYFDFEEKSAENVISEVKESEKQIKKGKFVEVDSKMSDEEIDDLLMN